MHTSNARAETQSGRPLLPQGALALRSSSVGLQLACSNINCIYHFSNEAPEVHLPPLHVRQFSDEQGQGHAVSLR